MAYRLHERFGLGSSMLLSTLLVMIFPYQVRAQQCEPSMTPFSPAAATPTSIADPIDPDFPFLPDSAAFTTSSIPSPTDSANYASHDKTSSEDKGVLNYYFLILAVFIIVLVFVYWSFAHRRRRKTTMTRNGQQSALAQDLESWPGGRRGLGRWRFHTAEPRMEEGLNERGEAPPPYLKEPDHVYHGRGGEEVELHDVPSREGKPPDYEEGP